jgi:hypothetical protein
MDIKPLTKSFSPMRPRRHPAPQEPQAVEDRRRAGAVARKEALRAAKYLGRAIWRNWIVGRPLQQKHEQSISLFTADAINAGLLK